MIPRKRHRKTILVVDDDAEWREFIYRVLGNQYPVQFATSGEEALSIARSTHPDAIILDIMMPGGKGGFTTYCELRNNPETSDIPVVILTEVNTITDCDFDSEILKRYLGYAPSVFLEKPIKPARLHAEIKHVLEPDAD
jgi:CheY-like chemotaxis protein